MFIYILEAAACCVSPWCQCFAHGSCTLSALKIWWYIYSEWSDKFCVYNMKTYEHAFQAE